MSLFKSYEQFLCDNPHQLFRVEEFLADLSLPSASHDFVGKVAKTQMFQRFLEERKNDPCAPLFLFFDECIIAKQNRSRRLNMRQRDTPFLDDTSGAIKETFTPPPPSNWGLPDDGRSYHYGSFPKFNNELFGKIRHPMRWKKDRRVSSLGMMPAIMLPKSNRGPSWQHEILSRSLVPSSTAPGTFLWAAKQGYKTLESAIGVLSQTNNSQGSLLDNSLPGFTGWKATAQSNSVVDAREGYREISAATLVAAQSMLVNARRIKGVLLTVICKFQAIRRMHMDRRKYLRFLRALRFLQYQWRRHVPEGLAEVDELDRARHSVVKIQRLVRAFLLSLDFRKNRAAVAFIQRWYRGAACRKRIKSLERACKRIQTLVRSRRAQFGLRLLRKMIGKAQARGRGYLTRKRIMSLNQLKMMRYREQIFSLWCRAHTPLTYRTKFWPMISDHCGFLRLRIAESELERLWIVLEVDFNSGSFRNLNVHDNDTEELRLAKLLGITDHTYWRYLKVQEMTASVLLFPAEERRNTELRLSSDRVEAERIQIYDRLSSSHPNIASLLGTFYAMFNIEQKDKGKKYRLAEIVCKCAILGQIFNFLLAVFFG